MTLLSICQNAADEIGILRPTEVASSTDPNIRRLFRYANKVGDRLMRVFAWQDLRKEHSYTATKSVIQTEADWKPSDFDRFCPETFWDRSNNYNISGPISSTEWATLRSGTYEGTRKFAYRGGELLVFPIPQGAARFAFEYVSKNWAKDSGGTSKANFEADSDTAVIDEDLITYGVRYEFLEAEGLPSAHAAAQYEERFELLIGNDQPNVAILVAGDLFGVGRHFTGEPGQSSEQISGDESAPVLGNSNIILGA
mgnify:FL=1|tara:strand:+ start:251 stop:1012 length:762 start_codon:yes stop_codon:yes gene_type:complete